MNDDFLHQNKVIAGFGKTSVSQIASLIHIWAIVDQPHNTLPFYQMGNNAISAESNCSVVLRGFKSG